LVYCPALKRRSPPSCRNQRVLAPKSKKRSARPYPSYTKSLSVKVDTPLSGSYSSVSGPDNCVRQIRGNSRDRIDGHLAACKLVRHAQARASLQAARRPRPTRGGKTCVPCGQVQINTFHPRLSPSSLFFFLFFCNCPSSAYTTCTHEDSGNECTLHRRAFEARLRNELPECAAGSGARTPAGRSAGAFGFQRPERKEEPRTPAEKVREGCCSNMLCTGYQRSNAPKTSSSEGKTIPGFGVGFLTEEFQDPRNENVYVHTRLSPAENRVQPLIRWACN